LVWFGLIAVTLQIQFLSYPRLPKHVMTASNSHLESQTMEKIDEIVESDVCIRVSFEYALQNLIGGHFRILTQRACFAVC